MTSLCLSLFALHGVLLLQQLEPAPAPAGVLNNWETVLGQAIILITTIAGFWYTIYRENRKRRWDLEDRELARIELARTLAQSQQTITDTTLKTHQVLIEKIDENTEVSKQTFNEADHINRKFADLAKAFDSVRRGGDTSD